MRSAVWKSIEATPRLERLYRAYRRLPDPVRAVLRGLAAPLRSSAASMVLARSRETAVAGPFKGMALELSPVSRRHLLSYVLGTAELELRGVVDRAAARRYGTILNVGAADGYYAVGLAMRSPASRIEAFEAKEELHAALHRVARRNGVADRIAVHGSCSAALLQARLAAAIGRTFVLMDIEGAEHDLLDPARTPLLEGADILVETHDLYAPNCTDDLVARFSATHDIERYATRPRVPADFPPDFFPLLPRLLPATALDLMDERRAGPQEWLHMVARSPDGARP